MFDSSKLFVTLGSAVFLAGFAVSAEAADDNLPPNAQAGECFARTFVPATYSTATEQVLKREAGTRIEVVPPRYELVSEQVLVKEASTRLIEVPAKYDTVRETIEIAPAHRHWHISQGGKASDADASLIKAALSLGVSENASPGECFAEYTIPARFESSQEEVLQSDATERIEIIPAKYEYVSEQVTVREAGSKVVEVPAVYRTVTEQVLVKPAHKIWKTGRGPIERVDHATGEIMCLVEVPAQYETISKRVLETPATTRTVEIPARYETVKVRKLVAPAQERRVAIPAKYTTVTKRAQTSSAASEWRAVGASARASGSGMGGGKATGRKLCMAETPAKTKTVNRRVLATPPSTRTVEIPAEYKTVKVRKLVEPAQEKRIDVPAQYATVTKRELVKDGHMSWTPVLCETNATPQLVGNIQRALRTNGFNPGPIDGKFGRQTLAAMHNFQKSKGLPTGGVTMSTLDALNVSRNR